MNYTIRKSTLSDIPALKQFELYLLEYEKPYDPAYNPDEEINYFEFDEYIESEDINLLIVELEDQAIGCGYAKIFDYQTKEGQYGYIGFMYVLKQHRNQGIGKEIVEKLINWLQQRNIEDIKLNVYLKNEKAIAAYEKMGFYQNLVSMKYNPEISKKNK